MVGNVKLLYKKAPLNSNFAVEQDFVLPKGLKCVLKCKKVHVILCFRTSPLPKVSCII